jgi:hypothetical protein
MALVEWNPGFNRETRSCRADLSRRNQLQADVGQRRGMREKCFGNSFVYFAWFASICLGAQGKNAEIRKIINSL